MFGDALDGIDDRGPFAFAVNRSERAEEPLHERFHRTCDRETFLESRGHGFASFLRVRFAAQLGPDPLVCTLQPRVGASHDAGIGADLAPGARKKSRAM